MGVCDGGVILGGVMGDVMWGVCWVVCWGYGGRLTSSWSFMVRVLWGDNRPALVRLGKVPMEGKNHPSQNSLTLLSNPMCWSV